MGIVLVAFLAALRRWMLPAATITSTLRRTSSAARVRQPFEFSLRLSIFDGDVFSLHVAKFAQSLPNRLDRKDSASCVAHHRYPIRGTFFGCCASAVTA